MEQMNSDRNVYKVMGWDSTFGPMQGLVVPVDGALLQVEISPPGVGLVQSVHGHFSFQLKAWMMAAQAS